MYRLALLILLATPVAAEAAAPPPDTTWPCVQRFVPTISPGMAYSGELPQTQAPSQDPQIGELSYALASLGTPPESVPARIHDYAAKLPAADRQPKLQELFLATLQLLNDGRDAEIVKIRRFAQGQQDIAARVDQANRTLEAQPASTAADQQLTDLRNERDWNMRIYDERQKRLSQLCESPTLLEQRAFAVGRAISAELSK